MFDKELTSGIYKELLQINKKMTSNSKRFYWAKILMDTSQIKYQNYQQVHEKMLTQEMTVKNFKSMNIKKRRTGETWGVVMDIWYDRNV